MQGSLSKWRNWMRAAALNARPPEMLRRIVLPAETMSIEDKNSETDVAENLSERYMLWIDGVGAWQLLAGNEFLIGGPTMEQKAADICLMANLSRRHATLKRSGEDWFIHPYQSTVISGKSVTSQTLLRTGDSICLAERVRLGFRIPSVLSGSASIDFESHHRPSHSVNGIILMTDSVLLGPRKDHHICCPDWSDMIVIYRQDGQLKCRSRMAMSINGERVRDSAALNDGAIVSGEEFRFRLEKQPLNSSV
jgi:hypothetical protein